MIVIDYDFHKSLSHIFQYFLSSLQYFVQVQ